MIKAFVILLTSSVLVASCVKEKRPCGCVPPPPQYLRATVILTRDAACGKPVLLFEDTTAIKNITGYFEGGYPADKFVPDQLPAELNVLNKRLLVLAQKLPAAEEFMCMTIGANYPHVKILQAKAE